MKNISFLFKTFSRIFYYIFSNEKRYLSLLLLILYYRPKKILEVGVYNGRRAIQMIEAAKVFNSEIQYFGFDLFEELSSEILKKEESKKPKTYDEIKNLLSKHAEVFLYKGFSDKTLKNFINENIKVDFIFIDGGHSVETIKKDFDNCVKLSVENSIIVLDDFYHKDSMNLDEFGSNSIYEKLKKNLYKPVLLPFVDKYFKNNNVRLIKMFYIKNKNLDLH